MDNDNRSGAASPSRDAKVKRPGDRRSISRSATRALDVLELFGETRRPLRAIEMAKALGLHPSSMNQLLKTMVESAHLTFEAQHKSYLPSPRLIQFSAWMLASYRGDERIRDLMRRLSAASGAVVTLTTPNDLYMQILDVVGAEPIAEPTERGLRVFLFGSAIGAAHLATLPKVEVERLAARARIVEADVPAILAHAVRVREAGVADGPSAGGVYWSVALPLPADISPTPLVLGIAGPAEQIQPNLPALRRLMRDTVDQWLSTRDATARERAHQR